MTPNQLNDRVKVVTGYDQQAMAARLGELTKEREDAKAKLDYLNEMRKVWLDTAAMDWFANYARENGKDPSITLAEKHGRISNSYKLHLEAIKQAHEEWGALTSQCKQLEAEMMAATMQISFAKAEMNQR